MIPAAGTANLRPGFARPVFDSQSTFRSVLHAMAHPGRVEPLAVLPPAPEPLTAAAAAVCLTLFDLDTPVWLDAGSTAARSWLGFHCGCPLVADTGRALFALVTQPETLPPLADLAAGTAEAPEQSATVIIQVGMLAAGRGRRLTGPGIDGEALLSAGLPDRFWPEFDRNHRRFPQGVDVILAASDRIAALPRTVRVGG